MAVRTAFSPSKVSGIGHLFAAFHHSSTVVFDWLPSSLKRCLTTAGDGYPTTQDAFTPLARKHWSVPLEHCTSVYIRKQAVVAMSQWIGTSANIQTLQLASGSSLERCTNPECTDGTPPDHMLSEHSGPGPTPKWCDGKNKMCLAVGVLAISGTGTQLVGGNLSIVCEQLNLGTVAGDEGEIVTLEPDSGVYVTATKSINIETKSSIMGSASDGSTNEVKLRCTNCTINVGGQIKATVTNLTALNVIVKSQGEVSGRECTAESSCLLRHGEISVLPV